MRHRAFTWPQILLLVAVLIVVTLLAIPLFVRARDDTNHNGSCSSNLKQIGLGLLQYTQDYDEKYPILTTQQGWVGALQPYVKSTLLFQCPSEKERGGDNLTDYWFNRRLEGVASKRIADEKITLLAGDGEASDDPNASLAVLPPLWMSKEDSPARRHLDVGNYLFADGHVKAIQPDKITLAKPSANQPTFLVR